VVKKQETEKQTIREKKQDKSSKQIRHEQQEIRSKQERHDIKLCMASNLDTTELIQENYG
jgi:hypothetical protein